MNIMEQKIYTLYLWVLASAPVLSPNICLWLFYFLWFFVRGVKFLYWRKVLGFLHFEGKFWISFNFDLRKRLVGREEILTLVADQGLRSPLSLFSSLFVWYLITGAWGPARVYLFYFLILWKWKSRNIHPLYLVLMAKLRHFWTTNSGWRFGCALRMFQLSASPPC